MAILQNPFKTLVLRCSGLGVSLLLSGDMWRRSLSSAALASAHRLLSSSASSAAAVDSLILRSLKEHYLEVSKMSPPPVLPLISYLRCLSQSDAFFSPSPFTNSQSVEQKVNPPSPYTIMKGSLDRDGPALRREYKGEEITISVARLANIMPSGAEADDDDDNESINQLFLHVDVSKPEREKSLHFLCGLYPDAVGIHSVCLRPKTGSLSLASLNKYEGRVFQ